MDELTRGFINDEKIIILIDNRERMVFRNNGRMDWQFVGDDIPRANGSVCGDGGDAVHGEGPAVFDTFP